MADQSGVVRQIPGQIPLRMRQVNVSGVIKPLDPPNAKSIANAYSEQGRKKGMDQKSPENQRVPTHSNTTFDGKALLAPAKVTKSSMPATNVNAMPSGWKPANKKVVTLVRKTAKQKTQRRKTAQKENQSPHSLVPKERARSMEDRGASTPEEFTRSPKRTAVDGKNPGMLITEHIDLYGGVRSYVAGQDEMPTTDIQHYPPPPVHVVPETSRYHNAVAKIRSKLNASSTHTTLGSEQPYSAGSLNAARTQSLVGLPAEDAHTSLQTMVERQARTSIDQLEPAVKDDRKEGKRLATETDTSFSSRTGRPNPKKFLRRTSNDYIQYARNKTPNHSSTRITAAASTETVAKGPAPRARREHLSSMSTKSTHRRRSRSPDRAAAAAGASMDSAFSKPRLSFSEALRHDVRSTSEQPIRPTPAALQAQREAQERVERARRNAFPRQVHREHDPVQIADTPANLSSASYTKVAGKRVKSSLANVSSVSRDSVSANVASLGAATGKTPLPLYSRKEAQDYMRTQRLRRAESARKLEQEKALRMERIKQSMAQLEQERKKALRRAKSVPLATRVAEAELMDVAETSLPEQGLPVREADLSFSERLASPLARSGTHTVLRYTAGEGVDAADVSQYSVVAGLVEPHGTNTHRREETGYRSAVKTALDDHDEHFMDDRGDGEVSVVPDLDPLGEDEKRAKIRALARGLETRMDDIETRLQTEEQFRNISGTATSMTRKSAPLRQPTPKYKPPAHVMRWTDDDDEPRYTSLEKEISLEARKPSSTEAPMTKYEGRYAVEHGNVPVEPSGRFRLEPRSLKTVAPAKDSILPPTMGATVSSVETKIGTAGVDFAQSSQTANDGLGTSLRRRGEPHSDRTRSISPGRPPPPNPEMDPLRTLLRKYTGLRDTSPTRHTTGHEPTMNRTLREQKTDQGVVQDSYKDEGETDRLRDQSRQTRGDYVSSSGVVHGDSLVIDDEDSSSILTDPLQHQRGLQEGPSVNSAAFIPAQPPIQAYRQAGRPQPSAVAATLRDQLLAEVAHLDGLTEQQALLEAYEVKRAYARSQNEAQALASLVADRRLAAQQALRAAEANDRTARDILRDVRQDLGALRSRHSRTTAPRREIGVRVLGGDDNESTRMESSALSASDDILMDDFEAKDMSTGMPSMPSVADSTVSRTSEPPRRRGRDSDLSVEPKAERDDLASSEDEDATAGVGRGAATLSADDGLTGHTSTPDVSFGGLYGRSVGRDDDSAGAAAAAVARRLGKGTPTSAEVAAAVAQQRARSLSAGLGGSSALNFEDQETSLRMPSEVTPRDLPSAGAVPDRAYSPRASQRSLISDKDTQARVRSVAFEDDEPLSGREVKGPIIDIGEVDNDNDTVADDGASLSMIEFSDLQSDAFNTRDRVAADVVADMLTEELLDKAIQYTLLIQRTVFQHAQAAASGKESGKQVRPKPETASEGQWHQATAEQAGGKAEAEAEETQRRTTIEAEEEKVLQQGEQEQQLKMVPPLPTLKVPAGSAETSPLRAPSTGTTPATAKGPLSPRAKDRTALSPATAAAIEAAAHAVSARSPRPLSPPLVSPTSVAAHSGTSSAEREATLRAMYADRVPTSPTLSSGEASLLTGISPRLKAATGSAQEMPLHHHHHHIGGSSTGTSTGSISPGAVSTQHHIATGGLTGAVVSPPHQTPIVEQSSPEPSSPILRATPVSVKEQEFPSPSLTTASATDEQSVADTDATASPSGSLGPLGGEYLPPQSQGVASSPQLSPRQPLSGAPRARTGDRLLSTTPALRLVTQQERLFEAMTRGLTSWYRSLPTDLRQRSCEASALPGKHPVVPPRIPEEFFEADSDGANSSVSADGYLPGRISALLDALNATMQAHATASHAIEGLLLPKDGETDASARASTSAEDVFALDVSEPDRRHDWAFASTDLATYRGVPLRSENAFLAYAKRVMQELLRYENKFWESRDTAESVQNNLGGDGTQSEESLQQQQAVVEELLDDVLDDILVDEVNEDEKGWRYLERHQNRVLLTVADRILDDLLRDTMQWLDSC
eukprot:Clim_evm41s227 gene=Clim_evmTU41s227